MNAWLKTIIILSLANELKLDCIKIVHGKMSDKKWEERRIWLKENKWINTHVALKNKTIHAFNGTLG